MAFGLSSLAKGNSGGIKSFCILNDQPLPEMQNRKPVDMFMADTPSWYGMTVFRPMLPPSEDRTGLQPWYDPVQDCLSQWFYPLSRVVKRAGDRPGRPITFLDELPMSDQTTGRYTMTPYTCLYAYLKAEGQKDANFERQFLAGATGKGALFPKPSPGAMVQGQTLIKVGRDRTFDRPQWAALLLNKTSLEAMDRLIMPKDPSTGDNGLRDVEAALNPDVGNLCFGLLPFRFKLQTFPGWNVVLSSDPLDELGTDDRNRLYSAHVLQPPQGTKVPTTGEILNRWVPWDKLIKVMTVQEQLAMLCGAVTDELIIGAFKNSEFEEELPAHVKRRMLNQVPSGFESSAHADADDLFGPVSAQPAAAPVVAQKAVVGMVPRKPTVIRPLAPAEPDEDVIDEPLADEIAEAGVETGVAPVPAPRLSTATSKQTTQARLDLLKQASIATRKK